MKLKWMKYRKPVCIAVLSVVLMASPQLGPVIIPIIDMIMTSNVPPV